MSALLTDYCENDCPSWPLRTSDSLNRHCSVISATVLMDFFACADLKIDWTGFGLHSTQGINVFNHFHWNDSQVQPMMVFPCVCPKDMNLQGSGKTYKVPQIVPRGKCFLEALWSFSVACYKLTFKTRPSGFQILFVHPILSYSCFGHMIKVFLALFSVILPLLGSVQLNLS